MSNKLIDMLKRHEGVRSKVYTCSAGYETIGVGRNISPTGLGLDNDEIDFLLINDITRVRHELNRAFVWFDGLDAARKDAIIDIAFNLGLTVLCKFEKSLAYMASGDYMLAADEFLDSRWAKQVGNRAVEVTDMIRTGEYQDAAA
jgi:lysozyme